MELTEYINKELSERQEHLNLDEDCLERGGESTNHKGVLAQYLNTPIYGRPIDLCHACHNAKCSNPKHLYWGTRKENVQDSINNGTWKSIFDRMVDKYGYEEACEMNKNRNQSKAGKGNKGKPKSNEHKRNLSESIQKWHKNGTKIDK